MATTQEFRQWMQGGIQRDDVPSWRYVLGIGMIGGIGLSTLWLHLLHLITRAEGLYVTLIGSIIPLSLSAVLLSLSMWIHWGEFEETVDRIGSWCLAGTLVLIGVSILSISYQHAKGIVITDPLFVIADHATVGAILGLLTGMYDSQRHRRGSDLRVERERAQELSNRLTVLNRVFRHDLRSAVNVIQGNATLLQKRTDEGEAVIRNITAKADELEAMSDRVRQLEQLLEQDPSTRTTINLGVVLQVKAFKYKDEHPEINLETEIPESVEVHAVPLIEDAFDELLENAVEHNDASTPELGVTVSPAPSGSQTNGATPGTVTVRIRDNGPGMPENALDVLERGRETDLEHLSGLGLWLAYWAVHRSGGQITFRHNDPRGSVVEVHLPAAPGSMRDGDIRHDKDDGRHGSRRR
jgi:signal transduction histidine kinase